jgi:periplasmic glucans biosynthesis protein
VHAGFRLHYPNNPAYKDELVVFLGASYFRALGAGQQYGLSARGLAIDTVGGSGEEFPRFTDLLAPAPGADAQRAWSCTRCWNRRAPPAPTASWIRPGATRWMTVHARCSCAKGAGAVINTLGIAPLTSMYLHGENQPLPSDFRPEVHDSDGLMMVTGEGEWLWRPLQPPQPWSVRFAMQRPARLRPDAARPRFASYEDVEARYERRPSAWVEPLGDWGAGPRGAGATAHARRNARQHRRVLGAGHPARPGQPLDFATNRSGKATTQQRPPSRLGHPDPARLWLHPADAGAVAGAPTQVRPRFCRPGPGRPALPAHRSRPWSAPAPTAACSRPWPTPTPPRAPGA